MVYVTNAFSLQMVGANCTVKIEEETLRSVAVVVNDAFPKGEVQFAIGHQDTAAVARGLLNGEIAKLSGGWIELSAEQVFKRSTIQLTAGDVLYVLQVVGGRLPEGCVVLPEGINMVWRRVTLR